MQPELPKKKEKPLVKTPIPGTEWLRVRTTEGNVFYAHKVRKESVWVVPEEIKGAVEALQKKEQSHTSGDQEELDQTAEIHRVKEEVQSIVKRKAEESIPLGEAVAKKAKIEEAEEDDEDEGNESEEEDWQREAAAQLAAEAEQEKIRQEQEKERLAKDAEAQSQVQLNIPDRVDLSVEEAKALFKASMGNAIFPFSWWLIIVL